tara:strand:+ start:2953 stop:3498 length:546 start_codon:yes stop_codon:yes gene_type:complete
LLLKYLYIVLLFFITAGGAISADSNTVSSTVVTDKAPPTASAPSVVVNNTDVCKSGASASIQTQILGIASGIAISDLNCERLKLSRSLYAMGMKVAAVSTLCQDYRVFDAMAMSNTFCPFMGQIGADAQQAWEKNWELIPEGSTIKDLYIPPPTKRIKSDTPIQLEPKNGIIGFLLALLIL